MATTLRFVLLGDDRASAAFSRFANQVDKSSRSVNSNTKAMDKQGRSAQQASKGVGGLVATISGFDSVAGVASSKGSVFSRVLAGLNLATGILEPAIAGVVVVTGALATSLVSAGAGLGVFGLVAGQVLGKAAAASKAAGTAQDAYKAKIATAQTVYQNALAKATTAQQRQTAAQNLAATKSTALTARTTALGAAYKNMSPAQIALAKSFTQVTNEWDKFISRATPGVAKVATQAFALLPRVFASLMPFLPPVENALTQIIGQLGKGLASPKWTAFVAWISAGADPALLAFSKIIGNVAKGVFGILEAFAPVQGAVLGGVTKMTAAFAKWGQTLPQHSGFQSLMDTFTKSTPLAVSVLKNLVVIIKNVATATTGLASPANSRALLNILVPLTGIIAKLSNNQDLVRTILYFALMKSTFNQLKPAILGVGTAWSAVSTGASVAKNVYGAVGRLAGGFRDAQVAESAFSGTAGTVGGALKRAAVWIGTSSAALFTNTVSWIRNTAVTVASKVAQFAVATATRAWTAAQWLLNAALDANPIGIVVVALAALAAGLYLAWTHSATFRKIVEAAFGAVKAAAVAVVGWITKSFVPFFTRTIPNTFNTVLTWVRRNWPWLLGALTGPIGLAVVYIIKHWNSMLAGIRTAWNAVVAFIKKIPGWILGYLSSLPGLLVAKGRQLIGGLLTGAKNWWNGTAAPWINSLRNKTLGFFASAPTWLAAKGRSIINGLFTGLKSVWGAVIKWFEAIPKTILGALGIHSPPDWAIAAGKHIMNGLNLGLAGGLPDITSLLAGVGKGVATGSAQVIARSMLKAFGWSTAQMAPLISLWNQESGWRWNALNPSSGAYGIPQSLPADKMAAAGPDWRTNPATQIRWGLAYIKSTYGSPAGAWLHEQRFNWYGKGGPITEPIAGVGLRTGQAYGFGEAGQEQVTSQADMQLVARLLAAVLAELRKLAASMDKAPARTGAAVGQQINGTARGAALAR